MDSSANHWRVLNNEKWNTHHGLGILDLSCQEASSGDHGLCQMLSNTIQQLSKHFTLNRKNINLMVALY